MRYVTGQVHGTYFNKMIISIKIGNRLEYFYLRPKFIKQFSKYLFHGTFVSFMTEDEFKVVKRKKIYKISYFTKIFGSRYHRKLSYYSLKKLRNNIEMKLINADYKLFLDLEMTMNYRSKIKNEIIQYGYLLVNKNGKIVKRGSNYIKPILISSLSKMTKKFLDVTNDTVFNMGINYQEFYKEMLDIKVKYKPIVVVWGDNDYLALRDSYNIHNVKRLFGHDIFINLQEYHKRYYNLTNDIGLFKMYEFYSGVKYNQVHDALEDAQVTKKIFDEFKDNIENSVVDIYTAEKKEYNI